MVCFEVLPLCCRVRSGGSLARPCEVGLQRVRNIVCVTAYWLVELLYSLSTVLPKIEVLGQIDRMKGIVKSGLLTWLLRLCICTNRNGHSLFAMIDVMPADESDRSSLLDDDDVPASREAYKAKDA